MKAFKNSSVFMSLLMIFSLIVTTSQAVETITYFHNDALGSPIAATDEAGNLKWREEYLPYGERLLKQDNDTNDTWFTGKQEDKATGLSYFGARWYDPVLGRFTGIDPVGFQEDNIHSFNRYAYANNNPYKFVDPDGREVVPVQLKGKSSSDPILKVRTYYIDKKIASDLKSFVGEATAKYPSLSVNNTFRIQDSSTIQTTNTKSKGLSRHQAGFAVDLNGTSNLSKSSLNDLRSIAQKNNLGAARKPDLDKPHFSANPTKHGYNSLKGAVMKNRKDYINKTSKQ